MIVSTSMQGLGAATPRRKTTITLDPIVIEGKVPGSGAADSKPFPWKWVAIGGGLLGLYLLAKHAKKKRSGGLALA